jgi:hypothetical protein
MQSFDVQPVINFLNRDDATTTGTSPWDLARTCKVSTYNNAGSVDGDYNSARLLPEMTQYGAVAHQFKVLCGIGYRSLRAVPRHSNSTD